MMNSALNDAITAGDVPAVQRELAKGEERRVHVLVSLAARGGVDILRELSGRLRREDLRPGPMVLAAAENDHVLFLEELRLHWGLTVDAARYARNWPLLTAAKKGHVNVIEELHRWGLNREDVAAALQGAAEGGHVNVLEEFHRWGLNREDVAAALQGAAKGGHINVLEQLRLQWELNREDLVARNSAVLVATGHGGHADVLEEFRLHWGLTRDDIIANRNAVLFRAALLGRLEFIQHLRVRWNLTREDVRDADAISAAAEDGHADVLREFRLNWGLTAEDARTGDSPLSGAAEAGSVDVFEELRLWGLTAEDARVDPLIVERAARQGHVDLLEELRLHWGLTAADARMNNNEALRVAANKGWNDVLEELRVGWGLTAEDARVNHNEALRAARKINSEGSIRELAEYGLTVIDAREAGLTEEEIARYPFARSPLEELTKEEDTLRQEIEAEFEHDFPDGRTGLQDTHVEKVCQQYMGTTCAICLQPFFQVRPILANPTGEQVVAGDARLILLPCGHLFHADCMEPLYRVVSTKSCPTCRYPLPDSSADLLLVTIPDRTPFRLFCHIVRLYVLLSTATGVTHLQRESLYGRIMRPFILRPLRELTLTERWEVIDRVRTAPVEGDAHIETMLTPEYLRVDREYLLTQLGMEIQAMLAHPCDVDSSVTLAEKMARVLRV